MAAEKEVQRLFTSMSLMLRALQVQEKQLRGEHLQIDQQLEKLETQATSLALLCERLEHQKAHVDGQLKKMRGQSQQMRTQLSQLEQLRTQLGRYSGDATDDDAMSSAPISSSKTQAKPCANKVDDKASGRAGDGADSDLPPETFH